MPIAEGRWRLLVRWQDYLRGGWRRTDRRKQPDAADRARRFVALPEPSAADFPELARDATGVLVRAQQHVWRGQEIVARQRELIFEIRQQGLSSEEAERQLRTFEDALWEWRKHLLMLEDYARERDD
jgi:hypothetical protein